MRLNGEPVDALSFFAIRDKSTDAGPLDPSSAFQGLGIISHGPPPLLLGRFKEAEAKRNQLFETSDDAALSLPRGLLGCLAGCLVGGLVGWWVGCFSSSPQPFLRQKGSCELGVGPTPSSRHPPQKNAASSWTSTISWYQTQVPKTRSKYKFPNSVQPFLLCRSFFFFLQRAFFSETEVSRRYLEKLEKLIPQPSPETFWKTCPKRGGVGWGWGGGGVGWGGVGVGWGGVGWGGGGVGWGWGGVGGVGWGGVGWGWGGVGWGGVGWGGGGVGGWVSGGWGRWISGWGFPQGGEHGSL